MSVLYLAGFDRDRLTLGDMTLADGSHTDIVVDLDAIVGSAIPSAATNLFWHYSNTSLTNFRAEDANAARVLTEWSTTSWGSAVQTEIRSQAVTNSWASTSDLFCAFDLALARYLIGYESTAVNIDITWTTATARALFGFAGDVTGEAGHTGTLTPTYVVNPDLDAVSRATPNYQAEGRAAMAVNAAGQSSGTKRHTPVYNRDWVQQFESKELVLITEAAAANPWTHEHLHDHCCDQTPFIVYDGGFGIDDAEVFTFAEAGLTFAPQFAADQWSDYYHVPYRCKVAGKRADS